MKTKRKMENSKKSEIRSVIEELSMLVKPNPTDNHGDQNNAHIPFKPFISVCNLVLQVLDKIGPTMIVLKEDIHQNIQRLELVHETDPSTFSNLVEILRKEASEGNAKKVNSCSRAVLWLTRSLDFTVVLLQKLATKGFGNKNMEKLVEDSYNITLKQWHGWISSTAVKVALKLVPDKQSFINTLMANDENPDTLSEEMQTLASVLVPLLEEIHSALEAFGLFRLKST